MYYVIQTSKASSRKKRLFACACVRRVWHMVCEEGRGLIERMELHLDGELDFYELKRDATSFWGCCVGMPPIGVEFKRDQASRAVCYAVRRTEDMIHAVAMHARLASDDERREFRCQKMLWEHITGENIGHMKFEGNCSSA